MKPHPYQIYIGIFIISVGTTKLQAFDLNGIPKSQLRSYLHPYLNAWVAEQSLPAALLSDLNQTSIINGVKYAPFVFTPEKTSRGASSVYLATHLGANILAGGTIQDGKFQGEYYTALSVFGIYRVAQKPTAPHFSLQLSHVKGFTDLHYRTISFGASRIWQLKNGSIALGYFQHLTQVKIHILDNLSGNYTTQKEYNFGIWQFSYRRPIASRWSIGMELGLGWKGRSVGLTCFYYL